MSPQAEGQVGAQQHSEVLKEYGGLYNDAALQSYVTRVGQSVARNTERAEVQYNFYVLNSPVINAFALPGGFVYVTRGLLAVMNDEAELAAVLGHEIGHVTGRHQAARYSQGVLASLGANVVAAAVGDPNVTRALGVGSNLYMSSYSRGQESEADRLGTRYLSRAGYDPAAMADFLSAMDGFIKTEARVMGKDGPKFSYFASHPQTGQRVSEARSDAARYNGAANRQREAFLRAIDGMIYGDAPEQGFTRGYQFYHPGMGFTFAAPEGYDILNQPSKVIAGGRDGTVIVLDRAVNAGRLDPASYITQVWLENSRPVRAEPLTINGLDAATASFDGTINGAPVEIRLVAIAWGADEIFRFQFAIPRGAGAGTMEALKRTTYSFRAMTDQERSTIKPQRIGIITAGNGDTVETMARKMSVDKGAVERFIALNNLTARRVESGRLYKVIQ